MLVIDLVIVGAVLAGVALLAGGLSGGRFERWRDERRRRQQGAANAELERRRQRERCAACDKPIEPTIDLWERDAWWHRACWRNTVEGDT